MKTRQILYAEEGMVLTDGKTFGDVMFPGDDVDISSIREITKEEHIRLLQEQERRNGK